MHTRLDALEQQVHALRQQTHTINRRLRWWRGLAYGVVVLAVLTWALPLVTAQEEAAQGDQKGLAQRVEALEKLLKHFSREKNEIFITGANLHIVNGLGSTDCIDEQDQEIPDCPNGLGNLIVGYNELRVDEESGAENIRTGSHNVVVGQAHNFSRFGGLVVGSVNTISGEFAVVSGGQFNTASGHTAVVSGGENNRADGLSAAVSGGVLNEAIDFGAAVSGGNTNIASGFAASISGGIDNRTSGSGSAVSGGFRNTASGVASAVSGGGRDPDVGAGNVASGEFAVVSGGTGNAASGDFSSVSGGQNITQETEFGWSAGSEAEEVVVGNFRSP
jgi:hypothetical protein